MLCFNATDRISFEYVRCKWHPEISHHRPGVPFIVVGTHLEKRDDPEVISKLAAKGEKPVSYKEGLALAKDIHAAEYIEVSALTQENVKQAFEDATIHALIKQGYIKSKDKQQPGIKPAKPARTVESELVRVFHLKSHHIIILFLILGVNNKG